MADIEKSARDAVVELHQQIQTMTNNLRSFSSSMRNLYEEEDSVNFFSEAGMKLRQLRDDTRSDAMVVLKEVLPLSTKFVTSVSNFVDWYEGLDFQQWCNKIPRILQKAVGYRQLSEMLLQRYEATLAPLKKRQDHARLLVIELEGLERSYERKKRELEDTASAKRGWAIGLAFVPFVNLVASPALACAAESDILEATRQGALAEVQKDAASKVSGTLIPALQDFVAGVTKAAVFFSVMEQEFRKFEGKAEKGNDYRKFLHYKVMKKEASDMKSICRVFKTALPEVQRDLSLMEGSSMSWLNVILKGITAH